MKSPLAALVLACLLGAPAAAAPNGGYDADVLIQAGHQGRPDCAVEPAALCNNTGATGEIRMTPIVADATAAILRAKGISVIRKPAHLERTYRVRDAVFLHFDGSGTPCASRASVGYPAAANSAAAAREWKALYARRWPFGFEGDNFTDGLRNYYGYKHVRVEDAAVLIEFGELTCPAQAAWLDQHTHWEAEALADFIVRRLHRSEVRAPR